MPDMSLISTKPKRSVQNIIREYAVLANGPRANSVGVDVADMHTILGVIGRLSERVSKLEREANLRS